MDLRLLKYFLMTAQEMNITSAAKILHITQPTLSKELKHLEDELGITLFERSGRNIALTEDGTWFRKRAREIIRLSDDLEKECIAISNSDIHGDLSIGVGEADFLNTIGKCVNNVHTKYPHIRFHMVGGSGDRFLEKMDGGELDFIVLIDSPDIKQYNYVRLPDQELRGLYMLRDMPQVEKGYVTPEDLRELPLILPKRKGLHFILRNWAGMEYDDLNVVATYNLIYAVRTLAENGVGCVMCNSGCIHSSKLAFVPLKPVYTDQFYVLYKQKNPMKPSARVFLEELRKLV